ncbi:AUGMIN subunit 5 [Camellia lanceoleosa]|uniref:AUGMIN subunit 5 n=1 Tax=Camellia lanceoleosa TaxID=1840588 RepID=A0ACC0HDM6_9ERIC|nr:AUGMIN subunit 5 [Camellia lanceoleosa]
MKIFLPETIESVDRIHELFCFVFWTLTIIPLLKYALIVLRADYAGEGNHACQRAIEKHKSSHYLMLVIALFGSCMTVGDGILTPALSDHWQIFHINLEVWAKEREVAGLRASLNTLMSKVQRLNKLCAERKEAEDSLRKKWKKIEEFDGRKSELESIYNALLKDFF